MLTLHQPSAAAGRTSPSANAPQPPAALASAPASGSAAVLTAAPTGASSASSGETLLRAVSSFPELWLERYLSLLLKWQRVLGGKEQDGGALSRLPTSPIAHPPAHPAAATPIVGPTELHVAVGGQEDVAAAQRMLAAGSVVLLHSQFLQCLSVRQKPSANLLG